MSLNISGNDAANFMTGQFVTPQFVTDQAMAAQAGHQHGGIGARPGRQRSHSPAEPLVGLRLDGVPAGGDGRPAEQEEDGEEEERQRGGQSLDEGVALWRVPDEQ